MIRSLAIGALLIVAACARRYETRVESSCPPRAQTTFSRLGGPGVHGIVRDRDTGQPLTQASVQLLPGPLDAITDSAGVFAFQNIPDGRYVLRTRRLGYQERADTVILQRGVGIEAEVSLTSSAVDRCFEVVTLRTALPWWHIW